MNLAVKLYQDEAENPNNIDGLWPSQVRELGESTELPGSGGPWTLMTQEEYQQYLVDHAITHVVQVVERDYSRNSIVFSATTNVTTGKWLDIATGNPSNEAPYIVSETGFISALSLSTTGNSSLTVGVYINSVQVATVYTSGTTKYLKKVLCRVEEEDEISCKVVSGSGKKPVATLTFMVF